MDFTKNSKELKATCLLCIRDAPSPMSGRVAAAVIYSVLRLGEIIDWWFPVKVSETVKSK